MKIEIVNWEKYNPRNDAKAWSWFRMQNDFFEDPDFDDLSATDLLVFIYLCCRRSKSAVPVFKISVKQAANRARTSINSVETALIAFEALGKIKIHEWSPYVNVRERSDYVRERTLSQTSRTLRTDGRTDDTDGTDGTAEQEAALSPPGNEPLKPESEPPKAEPEPETFTARQFVDAWNEHRGSLAEVKRLTASRADKIKTRRKEEPELAYWVACIKRMAASEFLTGKNNRGWVVDIEWLTENDTNHVKVSEGKYDNRAGKPSGAVERDRGMVPGWQADWVTSEETK